MAGLFGWGDMSIPLFDRLFVRRHTSLILRSLAVVVSAGRPIPPALYSPRPVVSHEMGPEEARPRQRRRRPGC